MSVLRFTERDLLQGSLLTPGWYRGRVEEASIAKARDGVSINYIPLVAILLPGKEYADCPTVKNWFNSKNMDRMLSSGYVTAITGLKMPQIAEKIKANEAFFDFEHDSVGKEFHVKIGNGMLPDGVTPTNTMEAFIHISDNVPF